MGQTPDSHDLDKLTRWHQGLAEIGVGRFPVCALFLATGNDGRAHDIFRIYRTAFEELGAGFHDLVIFGQHGQSHTSVALVPGLGLDGLQIPSLVLIDRAESPGCYTTVLPAGELPGGGSEKQDDGVPWKKGLDAIRVAVGEGSDPSFNGVEGLVGSNLPNGTLVESVGLARTLR